MSEPVIWVALTLSVLVHVAALWRWPLQLRVPAETSERRERGDVLVVQLAPPPAPSPAPAQQAQRPVPPPSLLPPRAPPPRPQPRPPVIALNQPDLSSPPPPAPATAAAPAAGGDLSSYIEARRQARAQTAPASAPANVAGAAPVEDDNARANRIAAANLGSDRLPTFGSDPRKGGGIFDLRRLGYDYAEFVFFGWNKDISRNTSQLIEVRKGSHSDIRLAVVRRMIAIIREYEREDFLWESKRLGRNVTLSARARDNSGLEDFMMREFFGTTGPQ